MDKISANRTGIVRSCLEGEEARSYDNPFTFVAYFPHSPVVEKYPDQPGMSKSREPLFILVRRKSRHEPSSNYCSCASRREVVTPTRFYNQRTNENDSNKEGSTGGGWGTRYTRPQLFTRSPRARVPRSRSPSRKRSAGFAASRTQLERDGSAGFKRKQRRKSRLPACNDRKLLAIIARSNLEQFGACLCAS